MSAKRPGLLIGVDTGGTFTDFVAVSADGTLRIHKRPSTPDDPARAVIAGLRELVAEPDGTAMPGSDGAEVTYGSTVATNAVLERKGARVVVLTTAGFEDLLEIGRQTRPDIYSLAPRKPVPLVPRRLRCGVAERSSAAGKVLVGLSSEEIDRVCDLVGTLRGESVAVCFLHSYANPEHEDLVGAALRGRGLPCSVSSELVAEYREYERLSTTVMNAYVGPVMQRHLSRLASGVANDGSGARRLRVLQSTGGAISVQTASREAVRTLLSGPAGGVVGALAAARRMGLGKILTLDMGGTSTDVSLVDEEIRRRSEWTIGDLPVKVPAIDIHTVGAGGGSMARLDPGGALKVGPESAGAIPGPACYGRGTEPTVTDADLALGRLVPDAFLGGEMAIDPQRALDALAPLARALGVEEVGAAEGIVRVVNAGMERALRAISVERGVDPREYVLVSFGGAAGMHACELAAALGMSKVLVPVNPGVLSAWGALRADTERSYVHTVRMTDPSFGLLEDTIRPMLRRAKSDVREECPHGRISVRGSVDARYCGQSYEIEVPLSRRWRRDFEAAHQRLYGYADEQRPVEAVNLRVVATVRQPTLPDRAPRRSESVSRPHRLFHDGAWLEARHFDRAQLPPRRCAGPMVITEVSATTVVPPGWLVRVGASGDLLLERRRPKQPEVDDGRA